MDAGDRRPDARASWCWASTRGRHAFQSKVASWATPEPKRISTEVFERFKELGDKKKVVADADIEAIVGDEIYQPHGDLAAGAHPGLLRHRRAPHGDGAACARPDGEIDDRCRHRHRAGGRRLQGHQPHRAGVPNKLTEFSIKAVTEGIDAVGEVTIRIESR